MEEFSIGRCTVIEKRSFQLSQISLRTGVKCGRLGKSLVSRRSKAACDEIENRQPLLSTLDISKLFKWEMRRLFNL